MLGLNGKSRRARMRHFASRTGRTMIVTLGPAGVVAVSPAVTVEAPGLAITPVDTVGAGDTFCGYFAAALAEGQELASALRLAAVAGSLACLKPGAQPAIPTRTEVEAVL
jgi:ribokinase